MAKLKLGGRFLCQLWIMYGLPMAINTKILVENVLDTQFEIESRSSLMYGRIRKNNSALIRNIIENGYIEKDLNRSYEADTRLCHFHSSLINTKKSDEEYFSRVSDTLSQDDIVRNQYSYLPYPAVSKRNLAGELQHYKNKRNATLYNIIPAFTLESLNHYLYQGRNDFKYVAESLTRNLKQNVHSLIFNFH